MKRKHEARYVTRKFTLHVSITRGIKYKMQIFCTVTHLKIVHVQEVKVLSRIFPTSKMIR